MTSRALTSILRCGANKMQVRSVYTVNNKVGNRELVGPGINNEPNYIDITDFPMPAVRYKEVTPDIQALREKEKGDWKKLSVEDRKQLYRASFRQTFAEIEAPTGEWKSTIGLTLVGISLSLWLFIAIKNSVYPPLPVSFDEERRVAQLERMRLLDNQPITGLPGSKK